MDKCNGDLPVLVESPPCVLTLVLAAAQMVRRGREFNIATRIILAIKHRQLKGVFCILAYFSSCLSAIFRLLLAFFSALRAKLLLELK